MRTDEGASRDHGSLNGRQDISSGPDQARNFFSVRGDSKGADNFGQQRRRQDQGRKATGAGDGFGKEFRVEALGDSNANKAEATIGTHFIPGDVIDLWVGLA